jgi:hypothetical protein
LFVAVSEHEYDVPPPLVGWLPLFLWDHLDDPVDQEDLHGTMRAHYISTEAMSDRARSQVLHALAEDLVPAVEKEIAAGSSIASDEAPLVREVVADMARAAGLSSPHPLPSVYRLPGVIVSDRYDWPMPFGLWPFVARLLRDHLGDDAVPAIGETTIDLRRLSGPARIRGLQTLAEEAEAAAPAALGSMVVGTRGHRGGHWDHPRALNEVRGLALVTRQVLQEESNGISPAEGSCQRDLLLTGKNSLTRRIFLDPNYLWTGEKDLYEWVIQFLYQRRDVPFFVKQFARNPWFEIPSAFSGAACQRVFKALATDLPGAVEADPRWKAGEGGKEAPFAAGRLKTLALMAADVADR